MAVLSNAATAILPDDRAICPACKSPAKRESRSPTRLQSRSYRWPKWRQNTLEVGFEHVQVVGTWSLLTKQSKKKTPTMPAVFFSLWPSPQGVAHWLSPHPPRWLRRPSLSRPAPPRSAATGRPDGLPRKSTVAIRTSATMRWDFHVNIVPARTRPGPCSEESRVHRLLTFGHCIQEHPPHPNKKILGGC